jgi:putative endonuclease
MLYVVYILESLKDGTMYTGQTRNLESRLSRHNKGQVKSTKSKAPFRVAYVEVFESRSEAMWREWELKRKWNTDRKRKLIQTAGVESLKSLMGL